MPKTSVVFSLSSIFSFLFVGRGDTSINMGPKGAPRKKILINRGVITTGATRQIPPALRPPFSQGAYVVEKSSIGFCDDFKPLLNKC